MTPEEQKTYEVEPEGFWQGLQLAGYDGYEAMAYAEKKFQWEAIGGWGKGGPWNLGSWPYVIIFFRDREKTFDVLEYSEGEVTMWSCPTSQIREAITNGLALHHWKHHPDDNAPPGIDTYHSVEDLPDELKGPYDGEEGQDE